MSAKETYFGKDSITPDFLMSQAPQSSSETRSAAAKSALNQAESSALSQPSQSSAKSAEQNFNYTGSGRPSSKHSKHSKSPKSSKHSQKSGSKKSRILSSLKKTTPGALIIGLIFAAIFALFGSASLLGNQIENLLTRATDTMFGSYSVNSVRVTKELLAGDRGNFPAYFEKRLNDRDITVQPASPGYHLIFHDQTITASNFDDLYQNDIDFREAFSTAKRGRTSNFFDYAASYTFSKISLSRNLFRHFRQTGNDTTDRNSYRQTGSSVFEGGTNTSLNTVTEQPATDENGKPIVDGNGEQVMEKIPSGDNINSATTVGDTPTIKARSYLLDISQRVSDAGSLACAALKVGNIISTAIAVNEIYQAIFHFTTKEESIAKTLGGNGEHAAMNQVLNDLSETKTSTYIDVDTGEEQEITGSGLESEGFANALAGEHPNLNKTRHYSVEAAFVTSGLAIGLTAANQKLCGGVRVAGAVISLVSFAAGGALFKSLITLAQTIAVKAAIGATISGMLSALIPRIAQSLFTNSFESLEGTADGEVAAKGVDLLQKKLARSTGQLLATEETATAYNSYTIAAAKKEAEIDRATHSPFDATNPNTFLGSFVGKAAVIVGSTNLISTLSSVANIFKGSIGALTSNFVSRTYAADFENITLEKDTTLSGTDFQSVYQDPATCPNLAELGAACDTYGAEITATHPDVINISSKDPKYLSILSQNVHRDTNGHYTVIDGSLLSRKIKYCDERDSPLGIIDANILRDFEISLGPLDFAPASEDVVDMVNSVATASDEAIGWARGSFCVMNPSTNPYYEDLLYLQHFEEDQRIAVQMQLDEVTDADGNVKNAVTAYKDTYYQQNPIDTSEAGLIAHFTGSTRDDAELTLAYLDYIAYLSGYDIPDTTLADFIPDYDLPASSPALPTFHQLLALLPSKTEYLSLRSKHYAA